MTYRNILELCSDGDLVKYKGHIELIRKRNGTLCTDRWTLRQLFNIYKTDIECIYKKEGEIFYLYGINNNGKWEMCESPIKSYERKMEELENYLICGGNL